MIEVIASDRAVISVDESGAGESLLLVHGASQTRAAWFRVAPLLANGHRVFNMDRRGRGESTDSPSYSLHQEAEDIARVVEELPGPVHLVAHSYGALCALEALRLTSTIQSAVLYEPPLSTGDYATPSAEPLLAALARGDNEGVLETFMRDYVGLPPAAIEASRRDPSWPARVAMAPTICREAETVFGYRLVPERFTAIEAPVLVLLGERSRPRMAAAAAAVAGALPKGELRTLANQGHVAMLTGPDLLADVIASHAHASNDVEI